MCGGGGVRLAPGTPSRPSGASTVEDLASTSGVLPLFDQALDQRLQLVFGQSRDPDEPGVRGLKLRSRSSPPGQHQASQLPASGPEANGAGSPLRGIRNCPLTKATPDFGVCRRRPVTTCGAALSAQPCGFARRLGRPSVWSSCDLVSFRLSKSVSFVQFGRE
jgi:hypothetical protein